MKTIEYYDCKDEKKCVVRIFNKEFHDVEVLPNYHYKCSSCKFNNYKHNCKIPIRFFDCKKRANKLIFIYNCINSIFVFSVFTSIFSMNLPMHKTLSLILASFVLFDCIFTFFEYIVNVFRDLLFYIKLNRIESKEKKLEEEKQMNEAKEALKEQERLEQNPYYQKIVEAEELAEKVREISFEYDFGESDRKIDECVEKIFEIIELLKEDNNRYPKARRFFSILLPEFYDTGLVNYANYIKAGALDAKKEEDLARCVDACYNHLNNLKKEVIFNEKSDLVDVRVRAGIEFITSLFETEGGSDNESKN